MTFSPLLLFCVIANVNKYKYNKLHSYKCLSVFRKVFAKTEVSIKKKTVKSLIDHSTLYLSCPFWTGTSIHQLAITACYPFCSI